MPKVKISPEAAQEFEEAAAWYEQEQRGLGTRFLNAFQNAVQLLREPNPPLTNVQGKAGKLGARKLILHKFPFSLIVREMHQSLVIVALAHHSRRPGYWKERITP